MASSRCLERRRTSSEELLVQAQSYHRRISFYNRYEKLEPTRVRGCSFVRSLPSSRWMPFGLEFHRLSWWEISSERPQILREHTHRGRDEVDGARAEMFTVKSQSANSMLKWDSQSLPETYEGLYSFLGLRRGRPSRMRAALVMITPPCATWGRP